MLLAIVKNQIQKVLEENKEKYFNFKSDNLRIDSDNNSRVNFDVSYIEEPKFGHVSSNIAMTMAKDLKQNPKDVAQKIVDAIALDPLSFGEGLGERAGLDKIGKSNTFSKIQVAGPGFINFTFSDEFLADNFYSSKYNSDSSLENILSEIKNKNISNLNNKNVLVEYTDPNPFKVFHIGHLMTNIIGESIAGIYELAGAKVKRINYQGDVGRHIAINIFAILKPENKKIFDELEGGIENKHKNIKQKVQWLGDRYAEGYAEFDAANSKEEKSAEDIKIINLVADINKKIYEKSDLEINKIYEAGRAWSLEYFETLYKMLGTKFDKYIFESGAAPIGLDIVMQNVAKVPLSFGEGLGVRPEPVFEIGDEGAVIFDGEKEVDDKGNKLHKRVFVNKNGLPTYEAKDLGNMEMKLAYAKENNFDIHKSIVITGNEQSDYFKVLYKAIQKINPELQNKLSHFGHGMMKFADGKMSSRKGNIIAGDELIGNVGEKLKEKFSDSRILDAQEKECLIEKVSIASIKYAVLRQAIGRDIIFDMDKVVSVEGDSGPYLQYTHARLCAVAKDKNEDAKTPVTPLSERGEETLSKNLENNFKININAENKNLILTIEKYEDVLVEIISEMSPHKLVTYLTLLCREVNSWYAHNRVAGDQSNEFIAFKTKEILAHGLNVLAVHAPEEM